MSAFSEANRKAFDELSATYNSKPWQVKLSSQIADALQESKEWIGVEWVDASDANDADRTSGKEVRLLDYACGTGAITKALGPWVTTIRGIDISEKMVKVYNEAARSSGLTEAQANAVAGDLFATPVPPQLEDAELRDFDVAVIGLGFHHFEDPALAVKRLSERLKPETGTLLIIDFLPFDRKVDDSTPADMPANMAATIKQNGFVRAGMEKLFTDAGLQNFAFDVLDEPAVLELDKGRVERTIFFARGRKPPTMWGKLANWFGSLQDGASNGLGLQTDGGRWSGSNPYQGSKSDAPRWTGGV